MKNVLIFTSDLYQGGVAESTRKISKILEDDFNVSICTYDSLPIEKEISKNINIISMNLPLSVGFRNTTFTRNAVKVLRYLCLPLAFLKLLLIVYKIKPNVVYSMTYVPNIINVLVSKVFNFKCIISERQDPREDLVSGSILSKVLKKLYPLADVIHVNSYEMIEAVCEYYSVSQKKIFRFDNFFFRNELLELSNHSVNDDLFNEVNGSKCYKIITSGRLSKQKGQWHLVPIISRILEKNVNVSLFILGEGELRQELEGLIGEYSLQNNIFLLGNVHNPHKYVSRCDLFIFPSIWESFGNTLVEAMGVGIPVVSTVCRSGPRQIINEGQFGISIGELPKYGFHLEDERIDEISNTIISLLTFGKAEASEKSIEGFHRFDANCVKPLIHKLFREN
ncbi:glycosyltransferase [Shewanella marisflavi]|uniref:glycosyltransferase n=1 Tax=Shewanella marisflavi TaxID=260364 RepID=UPI003AAAE0D0